MASDKGRAYFALSGYHFNPEHLTEQLGVQPTSTNAGGLSGSIDKPSISSWELSTDQVTDNVDVYALTDIIIKQLEPIKDNIIQAIETRNLSPRIGVVLELAIGEDSTNPDVGFGARAIRFMAEIGAFINVEYKLSAPD